MTTEARPNVKLIRPRRKKMRASQVFVAWLIKALPGNTFGIRKYRIAGMKNAMKETATADTISKTVVMLVTVIAQSTINPYIMIVHR